MALGHVRLGFLLIVSLTPVAQKVSPLWLCLSILFDKLIPDKCITSWKIWQMTLKIYIGGKFIFSNFKFSIDIFLFLKVFFFFIFS